MSIIPQNPDDLNLVNAIESFISEFRIGRLLDRCNARKEKGVPIMQVFRYKECHSLSYDALTAHAAIVFTRYMMIALEQRKNEDQRTLGELFCYFIAELVRANYNDLQNGVHETTEYLELFLRNLLLNEKNELHNREMHISGMLQKQDIEVEKQDIEQEFPYIEALYAAGFKAKSLRHAEKLYWEFGRERVFGRGDVVEVLSITASPASMLLKRLLEAGVIVPVSGVGKGKYRFRP